MPVQTIPLFGQETRRGLGMGASSTKDQYFQGCIFTAIKDDAANSGSYYIQKRPGLISQGVIQSSSPGTAVFSSPSTQAVIEAFGGSNSTIYQTAVSAGTITGINYFINETQISGVTYWLLTSSDGTGWYLVNGAITTTSYTGDTHTSTTVDNISPSTTGMYAGQAITGSGFQAGTRISSVNSSTSITLTLATTTSLSSTALTKTPIAKILSANFPVAVGGFAVLDGFIFVMDAMGFVYNSDINTVATWQASSKIPANISTDTGMGVIKYKNRILAFGNESLEFFQNAGNSFGSPLVSIKDLFSQVGMYAGQGPYNSVCQLNDIVYWVGNDMGLYVLKDSFTPKKLCVFGMQLGGSNAPPFAISAFRIGIDTIIDVASSTASFDKWYSIETGRWTEPNFALAGLTFADHPIATTTNVAYAVAGGLGGKSYLADTATYQDDGSAFTMLIQSQPFVLNKGAPFVVKRLRLIGDNQTGGTIALRVNDKDYNSSNWRTVGSFDKTDLSQWLGRGGYFRNHMIIELTDSHNSACRLQAIEVDWEPCS